MESDFKKDIKDLCEKHVCPDCPYICPNCAAMEEELAATKKAMELLKEENAGW